jgi:hypothetical protein
MAGITDIITALAKDIYDDPSKDHIVMETEPVVGPLANAQDPVGVRAALRKVGVQRIICKTVSDGWDFEGLTLRDWRT